MRSSVVNPSSNRLMDTKICERPGGKGETTMTSLKTTRQEGIREQVVAQWQSICQHGRNVITAGHGQVSLDKITFDCRWDRLESLACQFQEIAWQTVTPLTWDQHRIQQWSDAVAAQLQYLSEPLTLWELDAL